MTVRCTARLLKLLADREIVEIAPAVDEWYANLIWIDRRKCLLIVHADTLFPVFLADVRKPQLANFGQYLAGSVVTALAYEGLSSDCLGPLDPSNVQIARTASRRILGFMNEMAATSRFFAQRDGGIRHVDPSELNALLRRTLLNRGGYIRPIDAARQR